ncbi:MAG: ATP-grasp domain-containing protein [Alphaproteobacteria bacterium]|nr:ATP-grasp domain-containing protein [Alphaproteobacteria bacterium]MBL7098979.1 ATP-grasp domain-containing protein [Alphaproteobacteria bacterium]
MAHYGHVMGPRILLATTVIWPSAARLACAFSDSGARVEAVFPSGHMMGKSRYLSAARGYAPLLPRRSFANALSKAAPDLVVPCDDRAVGLLREVASHAPALRPVIERSLGCAEVYADLMDRSVFIQTARTMGIRAPETTSIADENALAAALQHLGFPTVLKADRSAGGEGVFLVHDLESATRAFRKLSASGSRLRNLARVFKRRDAHFLHDAIRAPEVGISAQRFVPGTPATTSFACWKGKVLAAIHMDVLETVMPFGPASVMRRAGCADMEYAAHRIAERFNLSGLHGLDFVRDADGRAHLIEINPRATPASTLALGAGRDLAAALVACIAPGVSTVRPVLTDNPVIALFPQEWRRNPQSEWIKSAYLDTPWDDPAVLRACLEPTEMAPQRPAEKVQKDTSSPVQGQALLTVHQAVGR